MFNKFDRIKIVADLNGILINRDLFTKRFDPTLDRVISEEYKSVGLIVRVNHTRNKLYIDISSKILAEDYINKINILNIKDVYKKLNNVITISPMQFYRLTPNSNEVASDINIDNIPETIETLYKVSKFQERYKASPKIYKQNNTSTSFWLKKNVITSESNEYFSIYNKYNELFLSHKNENLAFLRTLTQGQINEL